MGDISFECANCNQRLVVEDDLVGTEVHCPYCEQRLIIPDSSTESIAEPPQLQLKQSISGHPAYLSAPGDAAGGDSLTCPKCEAQCEADSLICVSCGYGFKTGKYIETEVQGFAGKARNTRSGNAYKPWQIWGRVILAGVVCVAACIAIYLLITVALARIKSLANNVQHVSEEESSKELARSALESTIDTNSVDFLEYAAENSTPEVQFDLASRFADGLGVPQDYELAAKWFQKVAKQNHAGAQYNLGLLCFEGMGGPQDFSCALDWYTKSAAQGFAPAQFSLGQMYAKGMGVPTNYVKAAELFQESAGQGVALARYNLGILLYNGMGVQSNCIQAAQWFQMAVTDGVSMAGTWLGEMYYLGSGVPQNREKALNFFRSALEGGDDRVLTVYPALLEDSLCVPFKEKYPVVKAGAACQLRSVNGLVLSGTCITNQKGAVTIATMSGPQQLKHTALDLDSRIRADASFREAFLGAIIEQQVFALLFSMTEKQSSMSHATEETPDTITKVSTNRAELMQENLKVLEGEADDGNSDAQFELALLYLGGEYVSNDVAKATTLFEKAAKAGNQDAQEILVAMYIRDGNTNGVAKWLVPLAQSADGDLAYRIATLLAMDKGNPQRVRSVFEWTQRAATNGSLDAVVALGELYMSGTGTEADPAESYLNFYRAANRGSPRGMYQLGVAFCRGAVVPRNESQGFQWLQKASAGGCAAADRYLVAHKEGTEARLRAEKENMEAYRKEMERHGERLEEAKRNPRYVVIADFRRHAMGQTVGEIHERLPDGRWKKVEETERRSSPEQTASGIRCIGVFDTYTQASAEQRKREVMYEGFVNATEESMHKSGKTTVLIPMRKYDVRLNDRTWQWELWESVGML